MVTGKLSRGLKWFWSYSECLLDESSAPPQMKWGLGHNSQPRWLMAGVMMKLTDGYGDTKTVAPRPLHTRYRMQGCAVHLDFTNVGRERSLCRANLSLNFPLLEQKNEAVY